MILQFGDFWGVNEYYDTFKNTVGVSAVLINTEKGKFILEKISDKIKIIETDIEKIKKKNHNLSSPTVKPQIRENILKDVQLKGYKYIKKKYLTVDKIWKLKLRSLVPLKYKEHIQCFMMKLKPKQIEKK